LFAAKSLKCNFRLGSVGEWDESGPKVERDSKGLGILHFDGIDLDHRRARLIGNQGAGDISVIAGPAAINFVERTPAGSLIVTTVFAAYQPNTTTFVAVTSRHVSLGLVGGGAVPSQYYGTCQVWE
jgi:hypothetical protein